MNDERLAQRAAAGDRKAFEAIFRRYHQDLYRFCLSTVGNPQDAQDALQNTMVKALRSLPGEEREIKLKPWLYRIARNESVEMLRKRRDSVELKPEQADSMPEIAETAAMRDRLGRLLGDLEELPERQRATLTMRELAGLDFGEIGTALGTSAAVARQTLYEARLSLRQMEAGREMGCDSVTRALSDGDGRVTRRRDVRAHLRHCAECRAFRAGIEARRDELRAIAPLPLAASAAVLHGVLGGGAAVATSAIVKSAATVAIVATVGVTAADRGGLIEVPLPGRDGSGNVEQVAAPPPVEGTGNSPAESAIPAGSGEQEAEDGTKVGGRAPVADPTRDGDGQGNDSDRGQTTPETEESSPAGEQPALTTPGTRRGRGEPSRGSALPAASSHGQQTAAEHKSPKGNSSPGTPRARGKENANPPNSKPSHGHPKPPTAPPPKSQKPPPGNTPPKAVPPDKPAPGPFKEPAAESPAADTSKEAR